MTRLSVQDLSVRHAGFWTTTHGVSKKLNAVRSRKRDLTECLIVDRAVFQCLRSWLLGIVHFRQAVLLEVLDIGVSFDNAIIGRKELWWMVDDCKNEGKQPSFDLAVSIGGATRALITAFDGVDNLCLKCTWIWSHK